MKIRIGDSYFIFKYEGGYMYDKLCTGGEFASSRCIAAVY